ncbi:MAG: hypothetical protein R3F60_28690 [bacterium]
MPAAGDAALFARFDAPAPASRAGLPGAPPLLLGLSLAGVAAATGPSAARPWLFVAAGVAAALGIALLRRPDPRLLARRQRAEVAIRALMAGDALAAADLLACVWWSNGPATIPLLDAEATLARLDGTARTALLDAEARLVAAGKTLPLFGG